MEIRKHDKSPLEPKPWCDFTKTEFARSGRAVPGSKEIGESLYLVYSSDPELIGRGEILKIGKYTLAEYTKFKHVWYPDESDLVLESAVAGVSPLPIVLSIDPLEPIYACYEKDIETAIATVAPEDKSIVVIFSGADQDPDVKWVAGVKEGTSMCLSR